MWNVREGGETIQELFWRTEVNKSPGRNRRRREAENNLDLENIMWNCTDWIRVVYFTDTWGRLNFTVMTYCVS